MKMGHAEKIWLFLLGLTLAGAWFAETGHAGWLLSLIVAGLIAIKSLLVIDYYMEMANADRRFRFALYAFVFLVVLLILVSQGWGKLLKQMTTIY